MPTFHEITLSLRPTNTGYVEVCLQGPSATSQEWATRPLENLQNEIERAENGYYVRKAFQEDARTFGEKLFRWLDGDNRMLTNKLAEGADSGHFILLKVLPNDQLPRGVEHLPWELLHDGTNYLIQQYDLLPYRAAKRKAAPVEPVNRALELVFMAASPQDSSGARLNYEQEEAAIIAATNDFPLLTEVEETGNLDELRITLDEAPVPVDIVHLSGHAGHDADGPVFETEDDYGNKRPSRPKEILGALNANERAPRLAFLSGCSTGRAVGNGYSLAAGVVGRQIPYVLGWAQPVYDPVATRAATIIYRELVGKRDIARATLIALRKLKNGYREKSGLQHPPSWQWHLPRLYLACLPATLVTGSHKVRNREFQQEFLDDAGEIKVPTRADFIGRRRQIQEGLRYLKRAEADAIGIVLQGAGGLGKSSLAKRLLVRLRDAHPVVVSGVIDPPKLLSVLNRKLTDQKAKEALNALQTDPVGAIATACALEIAATKKYPVFVLDDFEQNFTRRDGKLELIDGKPQRLTDASAAVLTHLTAALRRLYQRTQGDYPRLIVTCRYALPDRFGKDLPQISLASFQDEERKRLEERKTKQLGVADTAKSKEVAKSAAGNPRLLENLLAVLKNTDLDTEAIARRLGEVATDQRLDLLTEILLDHQTPAFLQLVALLATYEIPVVPAALAALDPNISDPLPLLTHGRDLGLIEEIPTAEEPRYLLMDGVRAVRDFAQTTQTNSAGATTYLYETDQALKTVSVPLELEIIRLGSLAKLEEMTVSVAKRVGNRLYGHNQFLACRQLMEATLRVFPNNYSLHHTLARAVAVLGDTDLAFTSYKFAEANCPPEEKGAKEYGAILHNLAELTLQKGDPDKAMQLYEQSLEIDEKVGDLRGKGATLHQMAAVFLQKGDPDKAMQLYEQSLEIDEKVGDLRGKGATLHQMAEVFRQKGDPDKAMQLYEQSLEIDEKVGDLRGKGATLHQMAEVFRQKGDPDKAKQLYEQSLEIDEKVGDLRGKGATLHQMAAVFLQKGDPDKAMQLYEQSLEIDEKVGDLRGKGATLHQMAEVFRQKGDPDKAMQLYEQSLEIDEKVGDLRGKGATLHQMAAVFLQKGDPDKAMQLYEQSLEIDEKVGDLRGLAMTRGMMGQLFRQLKEFDKALSFLFSGYILAAKTDSHEQKDIFMAILNGWVESIDHQKSEEAAQSAIKFLNEMDGWDIEAINTYAKQHGYLQPFSLGGENA